MSGHSKWSQIKHKKAATDEKKAQLFSKISRFINVAVKEGGSDLSINPRLKLAIEKAKEVNMPNDNIERAVKKGLGAATGENLEEALYEAYKNRFDAKRRETYLKSGYGRKSINNLLTKYQSTK